MAISLGIYPIFRQTLIDVWTFQFASCGDLEMIPTCVHAYAIPLFRRWSEAICICGWVGSNMVQHSIMFSQTILDILFKTHPKQRGLGLFTPTKIESVHSRIPDVLYVHICSGSCTYPHDVNVVWVGKTHWRHITVTVPQGEIARALTLVFLLTVLTCFDVWAGYEYAKGLGASSWITGSIALALQMSLLTLPFSSHLASGSQKPCEFWSSKPNTSGHLAVVAEKYIV